MTSSIVKPEFLSVLDAAQVLAISRTEMYELLAAETVASIKRGSRRLVDYDSVIAYADQLRRDSASP